MAPSSGDQARAMLARANELRTYRAELRQQMTVALALDCLGSDDWRLAGMRVDHVLMGLPGWGDAKAALLCRTAGVRRQTRLAHLNDRQRESIAYVLRLHADGLSPARAIHRLRAKLAAGGAAEERDHAGRRHHHRHEGDE